MGGAPQSPPRAHQPLFLVAGGVGRAVVLVLLTQCVCVRVCVFSSFLKLVMASLVLFGWEDCTALATLWPSQSPLMWPLRC